MENAVYSVDFTRKIKQTQAEAEGIQNVECPHCGNLTAKLVYEIPNAPYEESEKFTNTPSEEKKRKLFEASTAMRPVLCLAFAPGSDPNSYKRDLPKYYPEVNHHLEIVCSNCGNVAAKLHAIRDDMYAKEK